MGATAAAPPAPAGVVVAVAVEPAVGAVADDADADEQARTMSRPAKPRTRWKSSRTDPRRRGSAGSRPRRSTSSPAGSRTNRAGGCSRPRAPRRRRDGPQGSRPPVAAASPCPSSPPAARSADRRRAPRRSRAATRCGRQRRVELERASHTRSQLQHLDLHRDDPGEHHAEQRDPHPPADQPIEQPVIRQRADERAPRARRSAGCAPCAMTAATAAATGPCRATARAGR